MMASPVLRGIKVIELAGLAPGPFAGLLLADNGASVLRVDRAVPANVHNAAISSEALTPADCMTRRKSSMSIDLKSSEGKVLIKKLLAQADIVIDPFRPDVLEKLGLGYEVIQRINPKIILGRLTGFRRDGKYKDMAGHDINYIAVSGALSLLGGKEDKPLPPANILGDFAGGGAMLFQGLLLALLARQKSGRGQVVEANMVDGSAYLTTFPRLLLNTPAWSHPRGQNLLDGGAPWYTTYRTKDEKFMAVGAIEPQFFALLIKGLGLEGRDYEANRHDRTTWPELATTLATRFRQKTRAEWEATFDGTDACCTPVLEMSELRTDPSREGDQRPAVALSVSPSLAIKRRSQQVNYTTGQGNGVPGDGWTVDDLAPGQGGKELLSQWLGHNFAEENGGQAISRYYKL